MFYSHTFHVMAMPDKKVRIKMRDHMGVNGEDGTEWHGGEEHDATPAFARNLETRGLAFILNPEHLPAAATHVSFGDPSPEHRDPGIGGPASLLHAANTRPALTTASLEETPAEPEAIEPEAPEAESAPATEPEPAKAPAKEPEPATRKGRRG